MTTQLKSKTVESECHGYRAGKDDCAVEYEWHDYSAGKKDCGE